MTLEEIKQDVLRAVSDVTGLSQESILNKSRHDERVYARSLVYHFCAKVMNNDSAASRMLDMPHTRAKHCKQILNHKRFKTPFYRYWRQEASEKLAHHFSR